MTNPWSPKHIVTEAAARHLIETQFPELAPAHVQAIGEGFDNTVYQVNESYVFRFPRREIAVSLLQSEGRLLPDLVGRFDLDIPEPLFYGEPSADFPWPFLGYRIVHGLAPEQVPTLRRVEAAASLAEFLRTVHSYPLEKEITCGIPSTDPMQRFDLEVRMPQLYENMQKAAALDLLEPTTLQALQHYADNLVTWESPAYETLVHGDLHIRNILVDSSGTLTGVIDWGDIHVGHRALDLALIYSYLPPEGRHLFYKSYGAVDAQTQEMARFRAIFSTLVLMLYGHDQAQGQLVAATQESMQLALQP